MDGLDTIDHPPVVKLFTPELGSVRISEIASVRGRLGLPVERDLHFTGDKPLSAYADEARIAGYIKA